MNANELVLLLYFVQKEAAAAEHDKKTLEDHVATHRRAILTRVDNYCQQWSRSVRKLSQHLQPAVVSALNETEENLEDCNQLIRWYIDSVPALYGTTSDPHEEKTEVLAEKSFDTSFTNATSDNDTEALFDAQQNLYELQQYVELQIKNARRLTEELKLEYKELDSDKSEQGSNQMAEQK